MTKYPKIDGYFIDSVLGAGGMGQVFKAKQISMDRYVAIKVIPNTTENDSYIKRFEKEAKSVAKLNHPNIVRGIDHGRNEEVCYFVMEFIEGTSLQQKLEKHSLNEKKSLEIILQVSQALNHAYKNGIIHRDIKPDNIMITPDNRVLLCDLGLAKSVSNDTTLSGSMMGTPHYMSPEQCRGESDIDTRSDIYNLGITLFHMLVGSVPFDAPHAAAVCMMHISNEIPDPRETKNISNTTLELIKKMAAKDVKDRFQNPQELIVSIQDILSGKIIVPKVNISKKRVKKVQTRRLKKNSLSSTRETAKERNKSSSNLSTSRLSNQRSQKNNNNNTYIMVIVGIILGATVFVIFFGSGNEIDYETMHQDVVTLLEQKKWDDAFGKIKQYNDYFSYEKLKRLERQMSLFKQFELSIEQKAFQGNFNEAHALVAQLKEEISTPVLNTYVEGIGAETSTKEKGVIDKLERQFTTAKQLIEFQELLQKTKEILVSSNQTTRQREILRKITNKIDYFENQIVQKEYSEQKQVSNPEQIQKAVKKEKEEIPEPDPALQEMVKELGTIRELISSAEMEQAIEKLSVLDLDLFSSQALFRLEIVKIDEVIEQYLVESFVFEDDNLTVSNIEKVEQALIFHRSMIPFIKRDILEKQSYLSDEVKKIVDEVVKQSFEEDPANNDLTVYVRLLEFLRNYQKDLLELSNVWENDIAQVFKKFTEYTRKHFRNHMAALLTAHTQVFSIHVPSEKIEEMRKQNEQVLSDHLKTRTLKNLMRKQEYEEVQQLSKQASQVFKEEEKYYQTQRNEARIRDLLFLKSNNNNFHYRFDQNSESIEDWQLVRLKDKRKTSNKISTKFPAIGGGYSLFWKFPVKDEFQVEVEFWNPINKRTRRKGLSSKRWPNSFGIIGYSREEPSLMFLLNRDKTEIGIAKKRFVPLKRSRDEFPRSDLNPQTIFVTARTKPLLIEVRQKNIRVEHKDFEMKKDFYIGVINVKSSPYPLIIKSIKLNNVNFYTDKYLDKKDFDF
ncbi:protein kinase [Candidatus Uabimicrobium sp. HlEnr_7]|uniref:serine/threonine-protein kinase n=1 Tax=Candidatus Uabimicrobium helgolandensis TaxID=3095367 RepID=UPI00355829AF